MRITIFFFVLFLSVEVTANDNDELTLFSISDSALNVHFRIDCPIAAVDPAAPFFRPSAKKCQQVVIDFHPGFVLISREWCT